MSVERCLCKADVSGGGWTSGQAALTKGGQAGLTKGGGGGEQEVAGLCDLSDLANVKFHPEPTQRWSLARLTERVLGR
eukprot:3193271-Pyramimonas_sp.AAC.1